MAPESPKISLNTRLSDAINAIGSKTEPENIQNLFTEVCDDMLCSYSDINKTQELKNNLHLMHRIAMGPKFTQTVKEYKTAFIKTCGLTCVKLIRQNEEDISPLMKKLVIGMSLLDQPIHLSDLERNTTPNKPVNRDTNQLNY